MSEPMTAEERARELSKTAWDDPARIFVEAQVEIRAAEQAAREDERHSTLSAQHVVEHTLAEVARALLGMGRASRMYKHLVREQRDAQCVVEGADTSLRIPGPVHCRGTRRIAGASGGQRAAGVRRPVRDSPAGIDSEE